MNGGIPPRWCAKARQAEFSILGDQTVHSDVVGRDWERPRLPRLGPGTGSVSCPRPRLPGTTARGSSRQC